MFSGPLAVLSVKYLVADADLASEDLLIGLPVLCLFCVDTNTPLKNYRDLLDTPDCSIELTTSKSGKGGCVSELMVARFNGVPNNAVFESEEHEM